MATAALQTYLGCFSLSVQNESREQGLKSFSGNKVSSSQKSGFYGSGKQSLITKSTSTGRANRRLSQPVAILADSLPESIASKEVVVSPLYKSKQGWSRFHNIVQLDDPGESLSDRRNAIAIIAPDFFCDRST